MAPHKVSMDDRVREYKNELMYVFDRKQKIVMCQCCNCRVDWKRKSTVDNHCESTTHKDAKIKFLADKEKQKKQANIGDSLDQVSKLKANKDEFVMSTVRAFLAANILLRKLESPEMRTWMNKYIKGKSKFICTINSKRLEKCSVRLADCSFFSTNVLNPVKSF